MKSNILKDNPSGQGAPNTYGTQGGYNQMGVQPPSVPNPNQRQGGYPPQNIPGQQGSYMQNQGAQANRFSPSGAMPPNQMMPTSPGGQNYSPGMGQNRQFPGGAGPNPNYFPPGTSNPPYNQGQVQGQNYPGAGNPTGSVEKRPDEQQKGSSFGLLDTLQGLLAQKNQQQQAPKEAEKQDEPVKLAPAIVQVLNLFLSIIMLIIF